jgi:tripartite-type tricarboxylate transporter receptor subunit TctC
MTKIVKKQPLFALALLLGAVFAISQPAAAAWPERPVKVIVGFAPGGPTDLTARLLAQILSMQTGKNFFVENTPGAGGNVGAIKAKDSAADGYTILVTGGNLTNAPYLYANAGFDPIKDFDAVTVAAATPVVLAINPSVPAKTVKELIEWIRANPGKESFASPGTGTPPQLTGSLFAQALHLDLVHVPFSGGGTAVEATVGNHTPISFGAAAPAVPLIKAGQLRALAVTGKDRSPALPDVPTMTEAGYPEVGYHPDVWLGFLAPLGTPDPVIRRINAAVGEALASTEMKAVLSKLGFDPMASTPEEFAAFIEAELRKWPPILQAAGLKAE